MFVLTRSASAPHHREWSPTRGIADLASLEGLGAVVHLAGAPVADRPWTRRRRRTLRASRIDATATLLEGLRRLEIPPAAYVGVTGLWRYGHRGEDLLDESDTGVAEGFLPELARDWEDAHLAAVDLGCRTSVLRLATVFAPYGGVFPHLVKPFDLGFGGWLGPGQQFFPWLSLRDAVGALVHVLDTPTCSGSYNATVPEPVRNRDFFTALGLALDRRVRVQAPRWALRGAFGDFADEFLLASSRVLPQRLLDAGYAFADVAPEPAFRHLLQGRGLSRTAPSA